MNPQLVPTKVAPNPMRAPGEYLVTLAPGTDIEVLADLYGRFKIKRIRTLGANVYLMTIEDDPGPVIMEKLRLRDLQIRAVQPNFVYRATPSPKAQ